MRSCSMPAEARPPFRYWRDPVFLACLAIYFVNREWIKPNLPTYSSFFHGHLNDTLLVPVALPIFLFVYRLLGLRPDDAPPRLWEIALHLAIWILLYKWFGPYTLHRGSADPVDIVCFTGGGFAAWLLWRWLDSRRRLSDLS